MDYNTFMDDRNAGIALIQGAIALLIPAAIGYVVFRLVKPSTNFWESSPSNYGRLWLAYTLGLLFFALTSLAIMQPAGLGIAEVLVITPIYTIPSGIVSYLLGYFYGKSKEVNAVKKPKTIDKAGIEKPANKSIKKTVEKPQELKTEKNNPNNKTMEEENPEEINDEEYYLITTKEVEGSDRDDALWAKCMTINDGDEKKAKYSYIKKRVVIIKNEAKEKTEQKTKELEDEFELSKTIAKQKVILEEEIRKEEYLILKKKNYFNKGDARYELQNNMLFPGAFSKQKQFLIDELDKRTTERMKNEFK